MDAPVFKVKSAICSRLVVFLLSLAVATVAAAAPLKLTFAADGVTVHGISPGGDAVWFVRSVSAFNGSPYLSRIFKVVNDSDYDGTVELKESVKPSSVWVVVDFNSGDYIATTPNGGSPRPLLERHGNGWAVGRGHLDFDLSDLDVLLVRPGGGAWVLRSAQGTKRDGDRRADGNLRISLRDMERIHGFDGPPPVALPRDVVVAIEPTDLLTFVRSASGGQP